MGVCLLTAGNEPGHAAMNQESAENCSVLWVGMHISSAVVTAGMPGCTVQTACVAMRGVVRAGLGVG